MKKTVYLLIAAATLAGCATAPAVIPQPGGIYKTIAYGNSQRNALDSALNSAGAKCKELEKRFEVSDEKDEYLSKLPEAVNKAANVLLLLDGSEDYRVTLSFTCV